MMTREIRKPETNPKTWAKLSTHGRNPNRTKTSKVMRSLARANQGLKVYYF